MRTAHNHRGPRIALEHSLPSEVAAISPFVDRLMLLLSKCGIVPEGVSDVEVALREALANAIIHGNHEDPRKHVHVTCRCEPGEVSIAVKDEGEGFDINNVPDPTAPEHIGSVHGRGIHLMKAVMTPAHQADHVTMGMSLIVSARGVGLLPAYAQNFLFSSVTSRPLKGVAPTVDLVLGYRKSNQSPILKLFLSRLDELVARVSKKAQ